jgi:hypothetical protein
MVFVKPATVVQWHRQGFRLFCRWRSRSERPSIDREVRKLMRQMNAANPALVSAPESAASSSSSAIQSVFHLVNSIAIRAAAQIPAQMEFLVGTRHCAAVCIHALDQKS